MLTLYILLLLHLLFNSPLQKVLRQKGLEECGQHFVNTIIKYSIVIDPTKLERSTLPSQFELINQKGIQDLKKLVKR